VSWRSLAALGGLHVLLAGVLAAVLETAAGFWWHLGTHALLFVPLLLIVVLVPSEAPPMTVPPACAIVV